MTDCKVERSLICHQRLVSRGADDGESFASSKGATDRKHAPVYTHTHTHRQIYSLYKKMFLYYVMSYICRLGTYTNDGLVEKYYHNIKLYSAATRCELPSDNVYIFGNRDLCCMRSQWGGKRTCAKVFKIGIPKTTCSFYLLYFYCFPCRY